jgi:Asp-tRNA(Asn)/Glu-tRNA(Gln) amidotransferase A subunit family amidase
LSEEKTLNQLSASEAAHRIAAGEITSEAVIRACLDRITAREPIVKAWASLDPELALCQARACDRGPPRGALHGVPIGVKDVIDTFDLPTEMGSPIYRGHRPVADAACVALLRAAGAVILGKTVTCEFAGVTAGPTTNPYDAAHTPGGSSSGSGAAVADFMVPAALGTQTGGSVLRPSSYCGIIGYKPSFGLINRFGVKPAAETLDTIGLMARSLDDIELLADLLLGRALPPRKPVSAAPRIGLCRTYLWEHAQSDTREAVMDAANRLAAAGAAVKEVVLPEDFTGLTQAREVINDYERARGMAFEWEHHRDLISARLQATIGQGFAISGDDFVAALHFAESCRAALPLVFDGVDVLLAPAVDGEAPRGLDHTGSPRFQGLWTLLRTPALTLPTHRGPHGLPVGIQLIAPIYEDERLLAAARWISERLG